MKKTMGKSYKYVWNKSDFDTVDAEKTDYLLGMHIVFTSYNVYVPSEISWSYNVQRVTRIIN